MRTSKSQTDGCFSCSLTRSIKLAANAAPATFTGARASCWRDAATGFGLLLPVNDRIGCPHCAVPGIMHGLCIRQEACMLSSMSAAGASAQQVVEIFR